MLRLSPLSDPVMVNWPRILSASPVVNIVSSGWSVSAIPGRPSLTHRCCILNDTARQRGPGPGLGEQRGSLRTPPITPKRLPGCVLFSGWPILLLPPGVGTCSSFLFCCLPPSVTVAAPCCSRCALLPSVCTEVERHKLTVERGARRLLGRLSLCLQLQLPPHPRPPTHTPTGWLSLPCLRLPQKQGSCV